MLENFRTADISVGVIGLGLMGSSIIASLLIAGHQVKAIAPLSQDLAGAPERIRGHLEHCAKTGMLSKPIERYFSQLTISEDYAALEGCTLVQECVIEITQIKGSVYQRVTDIVSPHAVIASNTSAIPISDLQDLVRNPERFIGIHWAEPAYMTRFLEITCGKKTEEKYAQWAVRLAYKWGKEPTLLRRDIRGFITNRLMYSVYREGFALVQNGDVSIVDLDKAFRYDVGSWITLMGIFRRLDFLGLEHYSSILRSILPKLNNDDSVPPMMQDMVDNDARGVHNLKGLFQYTPDEAQEWEKAFALFNEEIHKLAGEYPSERPEEGK